jgi:DNA-binding MarR family transcriptional regulator
MTNPFLNEKKALLLMNLLEGDSYIRPLAEKSDTMYSHALMTLQFFEEKNLVTSEKEGRIRVYSLTHEGRKIADLIKTLWELTPE